MDLGVKCGIVFFMIDLCFDGFLAYRVIKFKPATAISLLPYLKLIKNLPIHINRWARFTDSSL